MSGQAHEHVALGILMKKYQNVSQVNLPLSAYDIIIVPKEGDEENFIRAQIRTAEKSVSFTGGSRGGVDRTYASDVKTYTHSTKTCDVIIGIHAEDDHRFDLYFVPSVLIEALNQKSISINKIHDLKNNYSILERCKDLDSW